MKVRATNPNPSQRMHLIAEHCPLPSCTVSGIFEVKGSHIAANPGYPISAWRPAATGALDEVKYFNLRVDR